VIGNAVAFEGLDIPDYPLRLPERQWTPFLSAPEAHAPTFESAADAGRKFVAVAGTPRRYVEAWNSVLG
jgi:hypothetical protein